MQKRVASSAAAAAAAADCHLPAVAQGKEVHLGQAGPLKVSGLLRSSETCMSEEEEDFSTSLSPL